MIVQSPNKLKVDKKIKLKNRWTFSKNVPLHFDLHIKKSVPFYSEIHWLTNQLSRYFVNDDSTIYDLGCSTGKFLKNLAKFHQDKKAQFIGIDIEKQMIYYAKKNNNHPKIKFINKDIAKMKIKKNDLTISLFTIQFVKQKFRQRVINEIFQSLNHGGAFIFAEKVRSYDARTQDMSNELYKEWKCQNGFSHDEINAKSKSIVGVLDPFSSKGNTKMLQRAGFIDIFTIAKYICFEVFIAIK